LNHFPAIFLASLLALLPVAASAEKADRDKPMNIEADNLVHDELRQD
jgi:lipopolysaccharide export system protein LptA